MRPYPTQEAGRQAECQRARRLEKNPVGHLRPACRGSSPRLNHERILYRWLMRASAKPQARTENTWNQVSMTLGRLPLSTRYNPISIQHRHQQQIQSAATTTTTTTTTTTCLFQAWAEPAARFKFEMLPVLPKRHSPKTGKNVRIVHSIRF